MFRKQDFKKIDLLGSGKKNTKIYKVQHIPTGKIYALKEIEAKNMDKLNEYKEEAVQLSKTQNHVNVVNFYGYYFYETMYNTYRLALVTEFIDQRNNLEYVFRKRKQQTKFWKENELEKLIVSIISTFSYLQSIGICHRDIKPANLFLLPNYEVKIIDFGESKDFYLETDELGEVTMATIRGTPQYLSPILWKAHVVDGNTRHVRHNIYKSDVFSCGLVIFQMASMDDVTGFNQKNHINDGEKLIDKGLGELRKRYSEHICEIIRLMLRFDEKERPTFVELAKLVLTDSQEPTIETDTQRIESTKEDISHQVTPKSEKKPSKKKSLSNLTAAHIQDRGPTDITNVNETKDLSNTNASNLPKAADLLSADKENRSKVSYDGDSTGNLLTQAELFKAYVESNDLFINLTDFMFWFEYGGNALGKYDITQNMPKWKLVAKYKHDFSSHFTIIFTNPENGFFLLGPNAVGTCIQYKDKKLVAKQSMPQEKSFFSALFAHNKIFTFGGYDIIDKIQLKMCEFYDVIKDTWTPLENALTEARSQSSACILDKTTAYIFGGYNKNIGTLNSIEKFSLQKFDFTLMKLQMPNPLRRFASIKIAPNKILLLGGIQRLSKESDFVFCVDFEEHETIERLDRLNKAGVIEYPIIVDSIGNLHLFIENCSGTSPPFHIIYSFLEYS